METLDYIIAVFRHPLILTLLGTAFYFAGRWSHDVQNKKGNNWWKNNRHKVLVSFLGANIFIVLDDEARAGVEYLFKVDLGEYNFLWYVLIPVFVERIHKLYVKYVHT